MSTTRPMTRSAGNDDLAGAPHDHTMRLVEVAFDDVGGSVQETQCTICGETTFGS